MYELSILELFILSCIGRGFTTPYLLQKEAGLSLGATSPTLPRLVKLGYLRRSTGKTSTNRPRHEYSLTTLGKQQARLGWKIHLNAPVPPADLDALLRLVEMATYHGTAALTVADLVKRAATSRANLAEKCLLDAEHQPGQPITYRTAKAKLDSVRYHAEANALNTLASEIGKPGSTRRSKRRK